MLNFQVQYAIFQLTIFFTNRHYGFPYFSIVLLAVYLKPPHKLFFIIDIKCILISEILNISE